MDKMIYKLDRFKIISTIIFAVIIFAILSIYANINDVLVTLSRFKWSYVPIILFLISSNIAIRFFKWDYYLRSVKINIKRRDSMIIFLGGLTMSITPAKMGEVFKSYLLKELNNTDMNKSAPIVFTERITDMIAIIILASIGLSAFRYGEKMLLLAMSIIIIMILTIQSKSICLKIISHIEKISFISKFANFRVLYDSTYSLFKLKNILITITMSIISWFFESVALFYVLKGFGTNISLPISMFVYNFSTIAGVVSMMPGGLGVTEGSLTGLLMMNEIPKAIAVGTTIMIRFTTLWYGVLVGILALSKFKGRFQK